MADDLEDELPNDDAVLDAEDDEEIVEPAGEPEDAEDEEIDAAPAKPEPKVSRSQGRIQRLAEERTRLSEENARLAREMEDLRRRAPPLQEDPRMEQERLSLMSPEDRMQYTVDKSLRENERKTNQLVFQMQQQQDKMAFDTKASADALYKKLSPDVEREYQATIARGQYAPREAIFTYLLGQRALAQRGKSKPKAAESRQRQSAAPVRSQGDAPRGARAPRGTAEAFERDYGDMQI